jgi:hypothetical protein
VAAWSSSIVSACVVVRSNPAGEYKKSSPGRPPSAAAAGAPARAGAAVVVACVVDDASLIPENENISLLRCYVFFIFVAQVLCFFLVKVQIL